MPAFSKWSFHPDKFGNLIMGRVRLVQKQGEDKSCRDSKTGKLGEGYYFVLWRKRLGANFLPDFVLEVIIICSWNAQFFFQVQPSRFTTLYPRVRPAISISSASALRKSESWLSLFSNSWRREGEKDLFSHQAEIRSRKSGSFRKFI